MNTHQENFSANSVFTLIKKDHRALEALFSKVDKTTERGAKTRARIYDELRKEITSHSHAEEKAVYPRLKEKIPTQDIGYESVEEHGVVKNLLKRLDFTPCETKQWTALMTVLEETIAHHVKEEETELFKKMRAAFTTDELKEMAYEFVEAKKSLIERVLERVAA